jgi:hypothetical protein
VTAIYAAWLLLSLALFLFAARTAIADLQGRRGGRSWDDRCDCLTTLDGPACGCRVPGQRQPERLSGRY